ncbi:hypothetical protein [Endozoicomonas elysicola]|uniref:DUF4412 domain-containing protein n=1 Tax=Endozoicomonas elysicola TaxID=305900 RepID=A0A081K794_9GAMM|nr:hypothetical protein [Endozoicomonas elysicola]KEI70020.1 hypothetical protein GV64_04000 [Endozoicomonas elysicola]
MKSRVLFFLLLSSFCAFAYSGVEKPAAGPLIVEMEGRGIYLTSSTATLTGEDMLTLTAPDVDWLGGMKQEHMNKLSTIDLSKLPELSGYLDKGIKHTLVLSSLELKYKTESGWRILQIHDRVESVSSSGGNIAFKFKDPLQILLDQKMEQVTLVLKTWPYPTNGWLMELGRFPMHSTCCDCSGWCAFLWILFAYCKNCLQPQGGEYCCINCDPPVPAAPGGTCP